MGWLTLLALADDEQHDYEHDQHNDDYPVQSGYSKQRGHSRTSQKHPADTANEAQPTTRDGRASAINAAV